MKSQRAFAETAIRTAWPRNPITLALTAAAMSLLALAVLISPPPPRARSV